MAEGIVLERVARRAEGRRREGPPNFGEEPGHAGRPAPQATGPTAQAALRQWLRSCAADAERVAETRQESAKACPERVIGPASLHL